MRGGSVTYSAITTSSTVLPKPLRSGALTGGPPCSCQRNENECDPFTSVTDHSISTTAGRIGECSIFRRVGCELVKREREILCRFWLQHKPRSVQLDAVRVGAHLRLDDLVDGGPFPFIVHQHDVGLGERCQAAAHCRLRLRHTLLAGEASSHDRLYNREQVLGAMVDLVSQQLLARISLFSIADIAGDLGGTDYLAAAIADRRNGQGDVDERAVLASTHCFVGLDVLAALDAFQDLLLLTLAVRRNDDEDGLADDFARRDSRRAVPRRRSMFR